MYPSLLLALCNDDIINIMRTHGRSHNEHNVQYMNTHTDGHTGNYNKDNNIYNNNNNNSTKYNGVDYRSWGNNK